MISLIIALLLLCKENHIDSTSCRAHHAAGAAGSGSSAEFADAGWGLL